MFRRTTPFVLILALVMAWAAPAAGRTLTVYEKMVIEFVKTQKLNACNYSEKDLKGLKGQIPVDQDQYGGAFLAALDDAIAARAQGACDKKKSTAPSVADQSAAPPAATQQAPPSSGATPQAGAPNTGAPAAAQAPPTPTAEPNPAASIAADDSIALASNSTQVATDPPFPVLLLAILAGLLALSAMAFGFARWFAWEPAWAVRFRHSAGEAGWRASSTFSEFADFVRLGR